ncbi:MAG TPA: lipid II flippase MurJ [Candidatus Polarisedimenticolia bacterium]|nr:lipid II flippase MurJ [Candidatus Polarisedimenticolia bacterium]
MTDHPSALRSTVVVTVARLAAAVLTTALGIVSARAFGTSYQKDAFLVAQTLPSILSTFVLAGVFNVLFVNLTAVDRREGFAGMTRLLMRVLGTLALVLGPVVLAVELRPALFVRLLAPGFTGEPVVLASALLRVTLLGGVLALFVSACSCPYQTRSRFVIPSIANLFVPGLTLVLVLAWAGSLGVWTLAYGQAAGGALGLALLLLAMRRALPDAAGFVPAPADPVADRRRLSGVWAAFLPMMVGGNVGQINITVDNAFASFLPSGSITMLGFAFVILSNAQLLTGATMAEVVFPRLASSVAAGSSDVRALFGSALRHMLMVTAPIAFGAIGFATPLVRALYERGAFTPEATFGVAAILRAYAPGIVFLGFLTLFAMYLTTHQRFLRVAATAGIVVLLNAGLDYLLMLRFGVVGIAVGTTLTTLMHAFLLGLVVRRMLGALVAPGDGGFALKVLGAATGMGALVFVYARAWETSLGIGTMPLRMAEAGSGLMLGAGLYVGLLVALRVDEARDVLRRVAGRFAPGWLSGRG